MFCIKTAKDIFNLQSNHFSLLVGNTDNKERWEEKVSNFKKLFAAVDSMEPKNLQIANFKKTLIKCELFLGSAQHIIPCIYYIQIAIYTARAITHT